MVLSDNPNDKKLRKIKSKRWMYAVIGILILSYMGVWVFKKFNFNSDYVVGQKLDSLNGVFVYYNGGVDHVLERDTTEDGYNLGLKYQCVEFVKRYYYQYLNHKMPDSYGHAKQFYIDSLADGTMNVKRNLIQYANSSQTKPKIDDLLIFDGTIINRFGHVAIVSNVFENELEIIQQNPGPFGNSRARYALEYANNTWTIKNDNILGWLRKEDTAPIN
ncbi:CHAP domain-containing protein [Sphingobacterium hungaricum]